MLICAVPQRESDIIANGRGGVEPHCGNSGASAETRLATTAYAAAQPRNAVQLVVRAFMPCDERACDAAFATILKLN